MEAMQSNSKNSQTQISNASWMSKKSDGELSYFHLVILASVCTCIGSENCKKKTDKKIINNNFYLYMRLLSLYLSVHKGVLNS